MISDIHTFIFMAFEHQEFFSELSYVSIAKFDSTLSFSLYLRFNRTLERIKSQAQ